MDKKIYVGAAYYPEMWDEGEIDKDIERCKEFGINVLRVGEFAWGKMEPKEGEFNFGWLVKVVDKLYENGISTVMCTPTCTPPRWLMDKYEETRTVGADGKRADVSSRCHVCKTSPVARKKNAVIVTEMAKTFAGHKGIIGWQIDNEIFPYDGGCYCPLCKSAFQGYLKDKWGSIKELNKAWGLARWSLSYDGFEDIKPPYPEQWKHPSLRKAWWDFQCRQIKMYVDEQAEILHSFGAKNVGTDMMPTHRLGYYSVNEKLDVVQFNHYDRAENLSKTAFSYDFMRCVKDKPFWVTETQVGWNGSEYADSGYRPAGNCYANTLLPVARGAEMNMYWLFRTHPNGHEMGHGALFSPAGRAYRVSGEVKLAAEHLERCSQFLTKTEIKSWIALHYSNSAVVSFDCAPIIKNLDYRNILIEKYYTAFAHYNVDVIDVPHSLNGYKVLISPFLAVADENGFRERVTEWVKEGGVWLAGPMTDIMNGEVSRYTTAVYGFLEEFAGVYVKYQKPIDNDVFKAEWSDGAECGIGICFDAFELADGTESLAKYTEGEFSGLSVITQRKIGKGKVILVGSVLSHTDILRLVNVKPIAKASDNVILTARTGEVSGIIAVETHNEEGFAELDGEYLNLINGERVSGRITVPPYGAVALKKLTEK